MAAQDRLGGHDGNAFDRVPADVTDIDYVRISRGATQRTTTATVTLMQGQGGDIPPMLLGLEPTLQGNAILPMALHGVTLSPASLHQASSARVPAAQLRIFSQLDPRRPLIDFVKHAAEQSDHSPRVVQVITQSMHGLEEPQITVTCSDVADNVIIVPVDLRPIGLHVLPLPLTPGMSMPELLTTLWAHAPEEAAPLLAAAVQQGCFFQDANGQVYDQLPQHLLSLQWLVIRVAGSAMLRAPPLHTTTTTTGMHTGGVTVQYIAVCDITTVRLQHMPITEADPQIAVLELAQALARMGRTNTDVLLQLAPALPWSTNPSHLVIPLLAVPADLEQVMILYDPGVDGTQIHSMTLESGVFGR